MRLGKLWTKLGILAALLVLISLCVLSLQERTADRSILTDDPCAAPCWQGIVPGKTTIDEALAILDTLGFDYSRFDSEVQWYTYAYYRDDGFGFPGNVLWGPLFGDSTSVAVMRLGLEFELTLQEVLDKYGPPEKFQAFRGDLPTLPDGHVLGAVVMLFYPQRGLAFESWIAGLPPVIIESGTTVKAVCYFDPTPMEQLFLDVPRMRWYLPRETWKGLQDWQGFGPIPEVY